MKNTAGKQTIETAGGSHEKSGYFDEKPKTVIVPQNDGNSNPDAIQKRSKKQKSRWILVGIGLFILAILAASSFLILHVHMETMTAIRTAIQQQSDCDIYENNVSEQIFKNIFNILGNSDAVLNIEITIPDYSLFSEKQLNGLVEDSVFDVSKQEADYISELSVCIKGIARQQIEKDQSKQVNKEIAIRLSDENGTKRAVLDSSTIEEIKSIEHDGLMQLTNAYYMQSVLPIEYDLYSQRMALLRKAFDNNEHLAYHTEVTGIDHDGDHMLYLQLKAPYPAGITADCESIPLDTTKSGMSLLVYYQNGNFLIDDASATQARAALHSYYIEIGEQLEEASKLRAASLAYGQGDNFEKACSVYDWDKSLQLSGTNIAALKLDGTVLFEGVLDTAETVPNTYTPDLSAWSNIIEIQASNKNIVGLCSNGTVKFEGMLWGCSSDGERQLIHPDLSNWSCVVSIQATTFFIAGLRDDGTVLSVGTVLNESGKYIPIDTAEWTNIDRIYSNGCVLAALRTDGTVVTQGCAWNGQPFDTKNWSDVTNLWVSSYAIVGMQSSGEIVSSGSILKVDAGAGNPLGECSYLPVNLESWENLQTLAISDNCVVGLKKDGTLLSSGSINCAPYSVAAYKELDLSRWSDIATVKLYGSIVIGINNEGAMMLQGNRNGYGSVYSSVYLNPDEIISENEADSYKTEYILASGFYAEPMSNYIMYDCPTMNRSDFISVSATEYGSCIAAICVDGTICVYGEIVTGSVISRQRLFTHREWIDHTWSLF